MPAQTNTFFSFFSDYFTRFSFLFDCCIQIDNDENEQNALADTHAPHPLHPERNNQEINMLKILNQQAPKPSPGWYPTLLERLNDRKPCDAPKFNKA
jgi:hypothetical protein